MNEVGSIVPSEDPAPVEQTEALPENSESAQVTAAPVASVESPQASESSQETVVAPEAAATEPLFVLPESDVDLTDVPDVALIDIDKLAEGTIAYRPEEELEESGGDMAEAKQDKKNKKKGKDVLESLQTALKQLTPEEQIATVMSKYGELAESNRQLRSSVKMIHKQVDNVQREKENMEAEHSKVILTKARLESLCRELQRQNKLIKEENVCRLREEEERRKEVSAKFNSTLSEISNLMKENSEKNNKLRDENQDMATRLQDLVKQYESRETHVEKILKAKDLQCQLVEAKLAKHHIEITENKEKMLLEKKGLLEDISTYQGKLQTMSETEITLRTQLNSYMEKYEEFQTTLDRSNKIFNTFKKEMDEMTKKIKKLEKETKTWKERWEGANKALLDMVAERSDLEKKMELQNRKNVQLQNLCRALQEQVTELRKQNKSLGGTEITTEIPNGEILTKEVSTETVTNAKEASTETVSQDIVVSTETVNETKESPIESPVESPIDDEDSGENLIDAIDVISEIVANSEHLLKEINLTGLSDNASSDVEKAAVSNVTSVVESAVDGNEQPVVANDTSNGTNSSEAVVTDFHDVD